ncbi:unnamed protein product [Prorocentrum cordatum]|uniref:Protein kinase domain-containing protein n=1 Tax=Prorocentrum cordatum TaxID=2364126 RepID=A0ABN9TTF8_9DINO|nr:unnamed protein product [Polarella glacialis]
MNMVMFNIIGLLALTLFAAIGKRAFERQERALFAGLLSEKRMRCQAEFQLSKVDLGEAARAEDLSSDRSDKLSRPGTTMSAAAFEGSEESASFDQVRAIGQREQWLIASGEVQILPDRVLGEGGFGIVVSGLYHNTVVAVKAPKQDIARKDGINSSLPELCNELRILRRIRHPNIAFLYGACMDDTLSRLCLVLEFVDGVPLGEFVRGLPREPRGGPAEPLAGASEAGVLASSLSARSLIVFDILNVLRYLHSRQPVVVHADLKDSNVFVEERRKRSGRTYHAKVLDFGLSRVLTRRAKPLGGTLRWMAPELFSRVPPDAAADCYSFGLLAYFIATGSVPFQGWRPEHVHKRLRRNQPPSLTWPTAADELALACRPLVEQCIQPRPALRPTAQQVSDELSAALCGIVSGATGAVAEQPGTGSAGSGSRNRSSGDTGTTAEDASVGNEFQEFKGLVEVRQAGGVSVGSLVPRMGSRDLPPVQEHEVLQTGESTGGAAAPPSTVCTEVPGSARARMTHPEYEPTPMSTQTLTLSYLLLQWNVSTSGSACCWLHGALPSLDRVREELSKRPCSARHDSMFCGQCSNCGLLTMEGRALLRVLQVPGGHGQRARPRELGQHARGLSRPPSLSPSRVHA